MNTIGKAALIVLAICVGVILLAPLLVSVLPDLLIIVVFGGLVSAIFGPRYRDRK